VNTPENTSPVTPLRVIELRGLFGDRNIRIETTDQPVTLLFGQNGVGKSTVLRVISQMLGPNIENLPQEPLAGALLIFEGGAQVEYLAGSPGSWTESFPDGTSQQEQLPELAILDLEPMFGRYVERETPFQLRDGKLVGAGGRPATDSMMSSIRAGFLRTIQQRRSGQPQSQTIPRRLTRDCFLISSDRLVSITTHNSIDHSLGGLRRRMQETETDVVEKISLELRDLIRDARQESMKQSWKLDGSFIKRAAGTLKLEKPLSPEQREALAKEISDLQRRMVNCALATSSLEIPEFGNDTREVKLILDLYLRDLLEKAKANLTVLPKLELFEEIINSHFTDKTASLQVETGLSIRRRSNDAIIPLDRLSSGERHLIVLFHHLLFRTSPGGLCLIDEPEISLHVDWQERFIDSIAKVASVSPQQYLIATHSPSVVGRHYDLMRDVLGEQI